ncbi:MAG: DUF2267 domain-containing protein [Nanobdellota archaeon]
MIGAYHGGDTIAIATVSNLEKSLHRTNAWIKEVSEELELDKDNAYLALKAFLNMMRDRLTVEEATDFGAQLPLILRGAYYDKWDPKDKPEKLDRVAFISRIHSFFNNDPDIDPERLAGGIARVLQKKISEGELKDIRANMPEDIEGLFTR